MVLYRGMEIISAFLVIFLALCAAHEDTTSEGIFYLFILAMTLRNYTLIKSV